MPRARWSGQFRQWGCQGCQEAYQGAHSKRARSLAAHVALPTLRPNSDYFRGPVVSTTLAVKFLARGIGCSCPTCAYPREVGRGIACSGSRQASGQIEAGALQVALGAACVDGSVAIELQVVRRDPEIAQRDPGGSLDGGPQCSTRVTPPMPFGNVLPAAPCRVWRLRRFAKDMSCSRVFCGGTLAREVGRPADGRREEETR